MIPSWRRRTFVLLQGLIIDPCSLPLFVSIYFHHHFLWNINQTFQTKKKLRLWSLHQSVMQYRSNFFAWYPRTSIYNKLIPSSGKSVFVPLQTITFGLSGLCDFQHKQELNYRATTSAQRQHRRLCNLIALETVRQVRIMSDFFLSVCNWMKEKRNSELNPKIYKFHKIATHESTWFHLVYALHYLYRSDLWYESCARISWAWSEIGGRKRWIISLLIRRPCGIISHDKGVQM